MLERPAYQINFVTNFIFPCINYLNFFFYKKFTYIKGLIPYKMQNVCANFFCCAKYFQYRADILHHPNKQCKMLNNHRWVFFTKTWRIYNTMWKREDINIYLIGANISCKVRKHQFDSIFTKKDKTSTRQRHHNSISSSSHPRPLFSLIHQGSVW